MRMSRLILSAGLVAAALSLGGCYRHPGHDSDYHHHHGGYDHDHDGGYPGH